MISITPEINPMYEWGAILLSTALLAFWVYALIDLFNSNLKYPHERIMWVVIILIVPFFGTFLYLAMSRTQKKRRKFQPNFYSTNQ